jgi:hypothetical protein
MRIYRCYCCFRKEFEGRGTAELLIKILLNNWETFFWVNFYICSKSILYWNISMFWCVLHTNRPSSINNKYPRYIYLLNLALIRRSRGFFFNLELPYHHGLHPTDALLLHFHIQYYPLLLQVMIKIVWEVTCKEKENKK